MIDITCFGKGVKEVVEVSSENNRDLEAFQSSSLVELGAYLSFTGSLTSKFQRFRDI